MDITVSAKSEVSARVRLSRADMIKLTARIKLPKRAFNTQAGHLQIKKSLDDLADEAKILFGKTTNTWNNQPAIDVDSIGNRRIIRIEGKVYGYVDKGTPPHIIRPRRARVLSFRSGYKAKTKPNVIGSTSGGARGKQVFSRIVHHPGTAARNFSVIIREKMQKRLENEAKKILKAYKSK